MRFRAKKTDAWGGALSLNLGGLGLQGNSQGNCSCCNCNLAAKISLYDIISVSVIDALSIGN